MLASDWIKKNTTCFRSRDVNKQNGGFKMAAPIERYWGILLSLTFGRHLEWCIIFFLSQSEASIPVTWPEIRHTRMRTAIFQNGGYSIFRGNKRGFRLPRIYYCIIWNLAFPTLHSSRSNWMHTKMYCYQVSIISLASCDLLYKTIIITQINVNPRCLFIK